MTSFIAETINIIGSTVNDVGGNQTQIHHPDFRSNSSQSRSSAGPGPSSVNKPTASCPRFNDAPVDLLSVNFTGREDEIALIIKFLETLRGNVPSRCALHGMHGVGKSQVSYLLAKELYDQERYTNVFWMQATTIEKLYQGFSRLLYRVSHPDRFAPEQDARLAAARGWLEVFDSGRWLLVVDNVSRETVDFLREHLPRANNRGSILFTTRTESVAEALTHVAGEQHGVVELRVPVVEDAARLLLKHLKHIKTNDNASKVQEVVRGIGCLPLAISQAAAYMSETGNTLDDMLTLFKSERKIDLVNWENGLSSYQEKSIAATFARQLEDLERHSPDASSLLNILAYLDPESISLEMLITGAAAISSSSASGNMKSMVSGIKDTLSRIEIGKGKNRDNERDNTRTVSSKATSLPALLQSPLHLQNALMQLQNRSLIKRRQKIRFSTLWTHDLIQLLVLENTKKMGCEQKWFNVAVHLVCKAFEQIEDPTLPACWPQCEVLIPHIQTLTTRQEISKSAQKPLLSANRQVARYLESLGRYDDAERLYEQVLSQAVQLFGPKHDHTLEIMHELAMIHELKEQFSKADALYNQVMRVQEKKQATVLLATRNQHLGTLVAMHNLAMVYESQGRHDDAEKLFDRVLRGRERRLGSGHVDTLATMHNLAMVYRSQGRYDAAEKLFDGVLRGQEKQFGLEHVTTLRTMHNLALVYQLQGRYEDAATLFNRVLRIQEKQLGLEHVTTLRTTHHLALVNESQGRYDDAETLFNRVLRIKERQVGSEHVSTLWIMHKLGCVYLNQGRYSEAEALLRQALLGEKKQLGPEHVDTIATMDELASVYRFMERFDEAMTVLVQVLEYREKSLGLRHPHTRRTVELLAEVYRKQGRSDDAHAIGQRLKE